MSRTALHPDLTDWDLLAVCGAPLLATAGTAFEPDERLLVTALRRALRAHRAPERQTQALDALLQALRDHYPSVLRRHRLTAAAARRLGRSAHGSGRLIKLRRLALARLSTYL